jgi:hypothetical protein
MVLQVLFYDDSLLQLVSRKSLGDTFSDTAPRKGWSGVADFAREPDGPGDCGREAAITESRPFYAGSAGNRNAFHLDSTF